MKSNKVELDPLTVRRHELALLLGRDKKTVGGTLTAEQRIWLQREQACYAAGGDFGTWAEKRQRIEALEAQTAAAIAEREAAAEQAAKSNTTAEQVDAALRAKLEQDADPLTVYKRSVSARTF